MPDKNKKSFFDSKPIDTTLTGVWSRGLDSPDMQKAQKRPRRPYDHRALPDDELSDAPRYDQQRYTPMDNDEDTVDMGNDNFWGDEEEGDDDDGQSLERNPAYFAFADKVLPRDGEIAQALDLVTNMPIESLGAAILLDRFMRGHMPDVRVNSMVASVILIGAANYEDIAEDFSPHSRGIVDDYYTIIGTSKGGMPDPRLYRDLSMDGQRAYIAMTAADLEIVEKEMTSGGDYPIPSRKEMREIAEFLSMASRVPAERPGRCDVQMMLHTMHAFNRVAGMMRLNIDLILRSPDMTITVRNISDDPQPGRMKPKFDNSARRLDDLPPHKEQDRKKKNNNNNKRKKPPKDDGHNGPSNGWGDYPPDSGPKTPDYFM